MSQTQLYERMLEDIQSVAMTLEDDLVSVGFVSGIGSASATLVIYEVKRILTKPTDSK